MTRPRLVALIAPLSLLACVRVPNPNFGGESESGTGASETGDGDGDPTTTTTNGDGDGTPGDGDGDGDGAGDGDGDGSPDCVAGELGCPCTVLETCDDGLACVLGDCIDASSCDPVDDNVQVAATPTYMPGDPPPEPPASPAVFICALNGQDLGNRAVLDIQCDDAALLQHLTIEVQPKVTPIEELLGNPNLAATVHIVQKPEGLFIRVSANGYDLYYINGTALTADGITAYPWAIASFSSACGLTPSMCGTTERLALFVDDGVVFDGNAAQLSGAATAWVETAIDQCGTPQYELVLMAN
jgi:hypothetical protein